MRFIYSILALLWAGNLRVHAQHTLSGNVSAGQSKPLDGAHIHIGPLQGLTGPDGYYEMQNIATGQQRVIISYIGYKTLDTLLTVHTDMRLDALLKPETTQLAPMVLNENVHAKTTAKPQKLSTATLEKYSASSLGDALKEIPGVYALKTGSTVVKPVINGLHSSRVPVIANNVRLEDQQWGTEHAPNLDLNSAGRVSVIKGANALQYGGDAIGGLVLTEPITIPQDTLYGRTLLNFASNGRGSSISSSLHKGAEQGWAWNASGTLKYFGDRQSPDYILSNTGNSESNFAGDIKFIGSNYEFSAYYSFYDATIGIAKATHIGNVADLVRAINSGRPSVIEPFGYSIDAPRQEMQHHLAKANFNKRFGNTTLAVQYAFQLNHREEYDMRRGQYAGIPALDLTLATHSLQADWKKESDRLILKGGISGSMQDNTADPDTGIRPLIPNYDKYDAGAYGIASYVINDGLTVEGGARYDFSHVDASKFYQKTRWANQGYQDAYNHFITADFDTQWLTNPKFTYHNISGSLGIRKELGTGYELLANAGLSMRNPNPSELFSDGLHHSNGTIELGSLFITKEKALKLSGTLLKTNGSFTFEATPYLNRIKDFIYLQPTGIEYTIRGAFPIYNYRQTDALLAGLDLQASWDIGDHWQYRPGFAYVYGQDVKNERALIDMPPLNITNILRYSNTGWHNLFLELRSEAVFRQGRYPDNNFYTDVTENGATTAALVDISTPPAGYHLLHFNSGISFNMFKKASATVGLAIYNILDTPYRDYLNRQRLYTDDLGRNIQLQLKFTY